jgi:hypothetical protein
MSLKKEQLIDARTYVKHWFENVKVYRKRDLYTHRFETLWLDYLDEIATFKAKTKKDKVKGFKVIQERDMTKAFNEQIIKLCDNYRLQTVNSLKCDKENLSLLSDFIMALTGKKDEKDIAVLAHFFWSVKRKMQDLRVVYHIMPIFLGKQGSGKSMAVSKMLGPFSDFVLNMFVNDLADKNSYPEFAYNAVVLFDELAGLNKTDRNVLKNQLTTEYNTYRPFYTQQKVTVPQRCCFIGTSNQSLSELFYDSTGMRRFYEIQTLDKCDWAMVNSIDYSAMIKGIDDSKENGYLEAGIYSKILKAQENYINYDDADMYFREMELSPTGERFKAIKDVDIYDHYRMWSTRRGHRFQHNLQQFNRKLLAQGLESFIQRTANGSRVRMFKVNDTTDIISNAQIQTKTVIPFTKGE